MRDEQVLPHLDTEKTIREITRTEGFDLCYRIP